MPSTKLSAGPFVSLSVDHEGDLPPEVKTVLVDAAVSISDALSNREKIVVNIVVDNTLPDSDD